MGHVMSSDILKWYSLSHLGILIPSNKNEAVLLFAVSDSGPRISMATNSRGQHGGKIFILDVQF